MHCKSYSHFFSKKFQHICVSLNVNFNESLTNDVVSFEQLGPELRHLWLCRLSWILSVYIRNLLFPMITRENIVFFTLYPLYHIVGGWVVRRCHVSFVTRGVQLILAYSWARPATLVAGKGREVMFLFLLFLHFHSCFSFFPVPPFHLFCYLFCLFSPFLWETTQNDPQGLTCR